MSIQQGSDLKGSDSTIDTFIDYLKERIESPFLMSCLVSWSVINRDFLFYLCLSEDQDKYLKLAQWDFSSFVLNWYCPFADSFLYPFVSGAVLTLIFSPLSMIFSGSRYYISKGFKGFAQKQKSNYDNIVERERANAEHLSLMRDLVVLKEQISAGQTRAESLGIEIFEMEKDIKSMNSGIVNTNLRNLILDVQNSLGKIEEYRKSPSYYHMISIEKGQELRFDYLIDIEIGKSDGTIIYSKRDIFFAEFILEDVSLFSEGDLLNSIKYLAIPLKADSREELKTNYGVAKIHIFNVKEIIEMSQEMKNVRDVGSRRLGPIPS